MSSNDRSGRRTVRSDFDWLWGAHSASIFGSYLSVVAIPLLAIARLDADAFDLSLLTAANLSPYLVAGLFVGVWVDRVRKRPLLMLADLVRAVCLFAIPLLVWVGELTLTRLLILTVIQGTLTVVFNVTDTSFLPAIVPRPELPQANARLALSTAVARIGGPAVAGGIIGLLSAPIALLLNGVTYLVSGAMIGKIGNDGAPEPRSDHPPVLRSLGDGYRTLRGNAILFALVFSAGLTSMFGVAFQTLLVIFLVERFEMSATTIGLLLATGGAGAVCGSLLSGRMVHEFGIGRAIVRAQLRFGLAGLIFPLALFVPAELAPALMGFSLFVQLAFNTVREVNGAALSQAVIPSHVLGRTQSTSLVGIKAFEVAGSLAAGGLALVVGTSTAIVLAEIGMLLAIAPMLGGRIAAVTTLAEIEAR